MENPSYEQFTVIQPGKNGPALEKRGKICYDRAVVEENSTFPQKVIHIQGWLSARRMFFFPLFQRCFVQINMQ